MPLKEDVTETQAGGVEQPKDAPTTPEVNIQTPPAQNDSVPPAAAPPVDSQQQSVKSNQESTGEIPLNTEELKTTNTSFAAEVFQYVESNPKINMGEITLEDFTSKYFNPDDVGSTAALWSTLDKKKASATYDLDLGGYHQFQSNAITVTPPKSAKLQQDFNDNKVVLSAEKEAEFQTYMETDPTVQDYKKQVLDSTGNEFDLDSSDTDYRKAWQSGDAPQVTNEKAVNGDSIVSWNTISKDGEKLKSQNHVDVQSAENDEEILANQMLPQFDEFDAENFFLEYSDKLKAIQASDIETQIPKHKLVSPNAPHIQEAIDAYNGEWEKSEKIKNEQMLLQTELGKSNPSAANRKGADVFWEKKYKDMGLSKTQIKELTDARKNAATNTAAKDVLKTAKVTRKKFEINPDGTTSQTSQDVNFVDITPREILFDIVDEEDLKKQVRDKGGDDRLTEALFSEMKETAWKQVRVEERAKGLEEVRNQYPRKDSEQHEKIYARKVASEVFEMLPEEDRELYEIEKKVAEFNDPSATPVLTNAIIAERFKLEERRRELTEQKRLYNPMTGQLVAQEDATKAQIEANDKVEADIEELKKLPLEEIEKQFTQRYLEFAAAKDRWETISAPLHAEATERMKAAQEKDAALMKVHPTSDNGTTGAYIVERTNEYDRARENFEEKSLELRAASGAYLLNKDATTIEKDFGYWSELFGRSAAASLLPEGVEKSLMAAGAIDMSDRQMLDYTQQAMGGGVFTDEQAEAFERNFGENVAEFGGGLVGIAIQLAVLNKATAAARIPQLINTLRTSEALGRFAKPMAFLLEGAVEEVKLQGLGFHSGEGYGFVAAGKVMPQMLLKGKIGAIMQPFFNAAVQGSVGGTVGLETATIMGTTVDALMENKDWQFRMEESGFGDLSEVGQRIATELMVNSVYGGMHIKKNAFVVDPQKLNTLATELIAKGHIQEAQSVIEKAQQIDGSQQALIEFNKTNDIAKISITKEGSKVEVESVPNEADVAEPAYSIDGESMSRDEFLNTINSSEFRRKVAEGADMSVQVDNDNNVTTKVSELYEAEKTEKKEGEAPAKPVERKKEEDDIKDGKIRFNVKSKAELPKEYQDLEPSTSGETTVDGKTTLNFTFDKIAETPIVEIPTGTTKRGDKVAVENKDGENNVWKVEAVAENGTVSVEDVLSKKKREFTQEEWAEVKGVETKVQETIDTEAKEEVETPKKKTADTRTDLEQAHVTKERLEEKATHPSGLNAKEKKALKKVDAFIKQEEAKAETTVKTPVVNEGDIVEVGKKNYKKVKSPVEEVGEYYQEVDADGKNVAESMPMKVEAIEAELAVVKLEELVEGLEKGTITKEEAKTETPVEAPKPEPITQEEAQKTVDDVKARLTERKRKGQMPINEFTKKSAAEKEIDTLDAEIDKLNSMGAVKRKLYEVTSELTVKGAIKGLEAERKEAAKTYQTEQAAKAKKSAAAAKKVKADEVSALEFELERAERALGESKGEVNLIKGDPVAGGAKDIYKTDLHFVQHLQNKTKKAEAHVAKQEKRLEDKKAEHKEFKVNDPKEIKLYEDFVADAKREVEKTKKEQETFLKKLATESKSGKIADNILGLKGIEAPKVEKKAETKAERTTVEEAESDLQAKKDKLAAHIKNKPNQKAFRKSLEGNVKKAEEWLELVKKKSEVKPVEKKVETPKETKQEYKGLEYDVPSKGELKDLKWKKVKEGLGDFEAELPNGNKALIIKSESNNYNVYVGKKGVVEELGENVYYTTTNNLKDAKFWSTYSNQPKAEVKAEVKLTDSESKLADAIDNKSIRAVEDGVKKGGRKGTELLPEFDIRLEEAESIKKELGLEGTQKSLAAIAKAAKKAGIKGEDVVRATRKAKEATAAEIKAETEADALRIKEEVKAELAAKKIEIEKQTAEKEEAKEREEAKKAEDAAILTANDTKGKGGRADVVEKIRRGKVDIKADKVTKAVIEDAIAKAAVKVERGEKPSEISINGKGIFETINNAKLGAKSKAALKEQHQKNIDRVEEIKAEIAKVQGELETPTKVPKKAPKAKKGKAKKATTEIKSVEEATEQEKKDLLKEEMPNFDPEGVDADTLDFFYKDAVSKRLDANRKAEVEAEKSVDGKKRELKPVQKSTTPIGSKGKTTNNRIAPAGRASSKVKPKAPSEIQLDLSKGFGIKIRTGKGVTSKRSLGEFDPNNLSLKVRKNNDLGVTAHEIGHFIDNTEGILDKWTDENSEALDAELREFWEHGSSPEKWKKDSDGKIIKTTAEERLAYRRGEGIAEYIRGWIINPAEAAKRAPEFAKIFDASLTAKTRKPIEAFAKDIRDWLDASSQEQVMSNVKMFTDHPDFKFSGWIHDLMGNFGSPSDGGFSITAYDRLRRMWTDKRVAVNKATKHAADIKGDELLPQDDPRLLARLFLGFNSKYNNIINNGMVDAKNNRLLDNGKVMNMEYLFEPLNSTDSESLEADVNEVISMMISEQTLQRIERDFIDAQEKAVKDGKDPSKVTRKEIGITGIGAGLKTDSQVAQERMAEFGELEAINPERADNIKEAARRYRAMASSVMRYAADKGRVSHEFVDKTMAENSHYVTLQTLGQREAGEFDVTSNDFKVQGRETLASAFTFKKAKGSDKTKLDPYAGLMDVIHSTIKEADRNDVVTTFVDLLTPDNMGQKSLGDIAWKVDTGGIPIFRNGVEERWEFQDDVSAAMKGIHSFSQKMPQWATAVTRLTRTTITSTPTFALRNAIRDTTSRLILSKTSSKISDFTTEGVNELELFGGDQAGYYLKDKATYYSTLKSLSNKLTGERNSVIVDAKNLGSWYKKQISKSETANRLAEFKSAYAAGKEKGLDDYNAQLFAAYQARDLMDFAVMGEAMQMINQIVPFSNAAVQGLNRTLKGAKENPAGVAAKWGLYAVLPTMMERTFNMAMGDYEELMDMPSYQKDMYWNFKMNGVWLKIPKPFELGALGSGVGRIFDESYHQATGLGTKRAFEGYDQTLEHSFLPLGREAAFGGLKPIIETMMNFDWFRQRAIVPTYENQKKLSLRDPKFASNLGKSLQRGTDALGIGMDARKIDHLTKALFSDFGVWAMNASDIGRDDKDGFGLRTTGLFVNSPAVNSPDAQWMMKTAQEEDMAQSAEFKTFKWKVKVWSQETDPVKREKNRKDLLEYSSTMRDTWEDRIDEYGNLNSKHRVIEEE